MRYIFFDVNGVLVDGGPPDARRWTINLERDLGIKPEDLTRAFFERNFPKVQLGQMDVVKALDDILEEIDYRGTVQTLLNYWLTHDAQVIPETMDIIKRLKARPGTRLFLATHQEKNRAHHLWDELGFKEYFEEIYFSGRMGLTKTDPRFFDLIEKELCFEEQHCVLVDNDPEVLEAARKAGWQTVLYESSAQLAEYFQLDAE